MLSMAFHESSSNQPLTEDVMMLAYFKSVELMSLVVVVEI
jgi:hypothetical protein